MEEINPYLVKEVRIFECPQCNKIIPVCYDDLVNSGYPYCTDCDEPFEQC